MTGAEILVERAVKQARARDLLLLMERKFGPVPPTVGDRVRAGTESQLDRWVERILTARTLDELFE